MTNETESTEGFRGLSRWRQLGWQLAGTILFAVSVLALLYIHLLWLPPTLMIGQVVPYYLISPQNTVYVDRAELAKLKRGGKSYLVDPQIKISVLTNASQFFAQLPLHFKKAESLGKDIEELALRYGVSSELVSLLTSYRKEELIQVEQQTLELISNYLDSPLDSERLANLQFAVRSVTTSLPDKLAVEFLQINIREVPHSPQVESYIQRLVTHPLRKGEVILSPGERVTSTTLDKLEAVHQGLTQHRQYTFLGLGGLLALLMLLYFLHLRYYKPKLAQSSAACFQLGIIFVLTLALILLLGRLPIPYVYYLSPLPAITMVILVATVYDPIFAGYLGWGVCLLAFLALGFPVHLLLYALLAIQAPLFFLRRNSPISQLVRVGLILGSLNLFMVIVVILVSAESFSWRALSFGFINGLGATIGALGLIPFVETLSRQLTPNKLQALLNPEHPLLKRLWTEAPGTYFHSLLMANMASEACTAIGADALLAKVGAMYHDIGKLKRPSFFVENLSELADNPHQKLNPKISSHILLQHITDGIAEAKRAKLPPEVIRFIPEHHGRGVMRYFLEQARALNGHEGEAKLNLSEFRYPGPNPQSKETAVVMLADGCEAKVRSLDNPGKDEIEKAIKELIQERWQEGLLNESGLTLGDINLIAETFTRVLVNLHHLRLDYPLPSLGEN